MIPTSYISRAMMRAQFSDAAPRQDDPQADRRARDSLATAAILAVLGGSAAAVDALLR